MTQVAFSEGYFKAVTRLTPNEQSQANRAVIQFQSDRFHSSLNFEKLTGCKDDKLCSIRVNQNIRIILAASRKDQVYLFLHIDHHDDAYQWATRRRVEINPETGALQVFTQEETALAAEPTAATSTTEADYPFTRYRDRELLALGVPEPSLEGVRRIQTETDLEKALADEWLPKDAYDGLFMLLAGATYEEAYQESMPSPPEQVDTEDFSEALTRPETLASFAVADNEEALKAVLSQSLEKWRVFLHPAQRRLVEGKKNGPVRVLGGAGTGKTVVAMHRARWLARHQVAEGQKILFTTFTRNLATDIQHNLSKICSEEELNKIEVINLDSWVMRFLEKQGYDFGLLMSADKEKKLWEMAYSEKPASLDVSLNFCKEEWAQVIQPQSITSFDEYKKASRLGRGTRLNRLQRKDLWSVFEAYRQQLTDEQLKEVDDAYRDARSLLEAPPEVSQLKSVPAYTSILVDEAQDMGTQAFMLLRALIPQQPNDLFIVGDGHQRIYGKNKVVLGQCGIDIRGRSARLKVNYRTTDETRKLAVSLLEGVSVDDLDAGEDNQRFYHSLVHGPEPEIQCFANLQEQAEAIKKKLSETGEALGDCCVVLRTRKELMQLETALTGLGIDCRQLDGKPVESNPNKLNLATMHRVKGLEFELIFLASANQGLVPLDYVINSASDEVTRRQKENEERSLVYVSLTRARKQAFVYGYGHMSGWF